MKYFLLFSILLIKFNFSDAQGTPVLNNRIGIKAGINLATLSQAINVDMGFKPGFMGGLYYQAPIKGSVSIQFETVFSMQGCKLRSYNNSGGLVGETNLHLNYLYFPLLLKIYPDESFNIHFGPQFGFLTSAKERGWVNTYTYNWNTSTHTATKAVVDDDVKGYFEDIDLGLVIGLGYDFASGINLGARFNLGLKDIYFDEGIKKITGRNTANRLFQFYLGYSFRNKGQ